MRPRSALHALVRHSVILAWHVAALGACGEHVVVAPDLADGLIAARSMSAWGVPSDLTASAEAVGQIDLIWRDNASNENGFEVQGTSGGATGTFGVWSTTKANVTTTSFTGLEGSQSYCFRVRAFTMAAKRVRYSEFSGVACVTTKPPVPVPPAAPSDARATPMNSTAVLVTWTDNSNNEEGFRVERSLGSCVGPWTVAATIAASVASYTDGGRDSEQLLCYRVSAFKSSTVSSPSPVTFAVAPAAPSNLTALKTVGLSHLAIDLQWSDNSGYEEMYEVQRAPAAAGPYATLVLLSSNTMGYRDVGLASGTTYWYRVLARRSGGFSDPSNTASAQTDLTPVPTPPMAAQQVSASPYGSTVAVITWSDESWNEDGFRVERSVDGGAHWDAAGVAPPNEIWFHDEGQSSELPLCYRVVAFNALGDAAVSNTDCTTLPAAPTDVRVTADGVFTWTDNSSVEEGFEIWYCGPEECSSLYAVAPNVVRFQDPWYYAGFQYFIAAVKDGGYSDFVVPEASTIAARSSSTFTPLSRPGAYRLTANGTFKRRTPSIQRRNP